MDALSMFGVNLRGIVNRDDPDVFFVKGNYSSKLMKNINGFESMSQRRYTFWLLNKDPFGFVDCELLRKKFFHRDLISEVFETMITPYYASFELRYPWGWMSIEFTDHTQYPSHFYDRTDEWLANPDDFSRSEKLYAIEIRVEPSSISAFFNEKIDLGDFSYRDRLIDMDLMSIAMCNPDIFFYGVCGEYAKNTVWRPGRHIKGFENSGGVWVFNSQFTQDKNTIIGDDRFFALQKEFPEVEVIVALGNDELKMLYPLPFSGSIYDPIADEDEDNYVGVFPLFGGRDPMDIFRSASKV